MVRIVTDTTSCLRADFAQAHNIPVIPQVINFGNQSYLEGMEMDNTAFMHRLKSEPELPKTAAPPPELFIQTFQKLVPLGETILCIHPSADVSGTVRSAQTARVEFPDADIRIVDTRLVASPLGSMVQLAVEWAEAGATAETIETRLLEMSARCRIYFMVASLDHLVKGGRIGGASALIGGLLQIKPILTFRDGKVDQLERARTHKQAVLRLKELVTAEYPKDQPGYLSVLHGGVPDEGGRLAEDLRRSLNLPEVPLFDMPPAIVTHAGPGVLGVAFFRSA
jgi:DegV family protein with EDD domain